MENEKIIKEFEKEYGINLVPDEPSQVQKQVNENLFQKLHRLRNREIICDLDVADYKRWRLVDKIISITLAILLITVIITVISNCSIERATRCNLVASPGATEPAHLGYKFTDELVSQIEEGEIDLYDVYIVEDNNIDNNIKGIRIENKYGFPIKNVCIIDAEYIKYSDEYINKMFSKEYIVEHDDDNWGYWEYTLDYQS